ncbi:DUF2625 family protein [[Clostridium] polysaccharolyticum]|uniref:DUF2625 family protein n=1 Tax=[Clostridium] polysaccharolyticum TaxID=29364 RepID=A0A1I0CBD8_9FIRM|nr:DUF2625 family protein [[Clostridium] polysaccharolyticum]SET16825.1 Protein of unknown function DUF2625 [[Clostridium] polysaccharolyticum]
MKNIWQGIVDLTYKSNRDVNIVLGNDINGQEDCQKLKISSDSVLYSIVFNSNGIIIDNWIRIWGQSSYNNEGVYYYNNKYTEYISGMILVGCDVVGGLFAINISRFNDKNLIWYFAPDTLEWECLDMKYNEFVAWTFQGNIDEFYASMRWKNWKKDVEDIEFNRAVLIYPFLWAKECDIEKATKKIVAIDEIIEMNFDYSYRL